MHSTPIFCQIVCIEHFQFSYYVILFLHCVYTPSRHPITELFSFNSCVRLVEMIEHRLLHFLFRWNLKQKTVFMPLERIWLQQPTTNTIKVNEEQLASVVWLVYSIFDSMLKLCLHQIYRYVKAMINTFVI